MHGNVMWRLLKTDANVVYHTLAGIKCKDGDHRLWMPIEAFFH